MKRLFPFIVMIGLLASCTSSREVSRTYPSYPGRASQAFYYYPSANVYFDGSCNRYIYHDGRSWVTTSILPSRFFIGNDRVQVYYNGPEVWRDNARHRELYSRREDRRDERRERHARYRDRD